MSIKKATATTTTTTLLIDMASLHLRTSEQLVFSGIKVNSWKLKHLTNYSLLTRLNCKPREIYVVMVENCLGDNAMRIYQGMQFSTPDTDRTGHTAGPREIYCWNRQ